VNQRIAALVDAVGRVAVEGSATKQGWLYHDYALPETQLPAHRRNTAARLLTLKRHVPLYRSRVLDIGCASGGMSIGIALLGASQVHGLDHDGAALDVGRAVAEKYGVANVEFHQGDLLTFPLPQADVIVWLSQWMWIVKQHGMETARQLLFDVPAKAGASTLVFESAAGDGKAAIPGTTQDDIEDLLISWTPFASVQDIGPFSDEWRLSEQQRHVFVCTHPRLSWRGKEATIRRLDARTVIKEFEPQRLWAKQVEERCLRRLAGMPHFPELLEVGDRWLKMEWTGHRARRVSQLDQLPDIIRLLADAGIMHRDICPENLTYRDGRLFLVDFGWAILDGNQPPAEAPQGLGRGFYEAGRWDDATAAERVRTWFKRHGGGTSGWTR
jgi:SAM-dependent methyltransferase